MSYGPRDALDIAALADRMGRIDPQAARTMGERARAGVEGLDLATMAERRMALYASLAPSLARPSS